MATVAENITLDDAIQKSQSMDNTSYIWIIQENVLGLEVPDNHAFSNIVVLWYNYPETLIADTYFSPTKKGVNSIFRNLKDGDATFSNFEELRRAHPKLFNAKGIFRILQR